MELGNKIYTPRFGTVKIEAIFANMVDAQEAKYVYDAMLKDPEWKIMGKTITGQTMTFAAVKKP